MDRNVQAFIDGFCFKRFWDWYDSVPEPWRFVIFMTLAIVLIVGGAALGDRMYGNFEGGAMGGALALFFLAVLKAVRRRG